MELQPGGHHPFSSLLPPKTGGVPSPSHVGGVFRGPAFQKLHLTHLEGSPPPRSLFSSNKNSDPSSWRPPRQLSPQAMPDDLNNKRKVEIRKRHEHLKV